MVEKRTLEQDQAAAKERAAEIFKAGRESGEADSGLGSEPNFDEDFGVKKEKSELTPEEETINLKAQKAVPKPGGLLDRLEKAKSKPQVPAPSGD